MEEGGGVSDVKGDSKEEASEGGARERKEMKKGYR